MQTYLAFVIEEAEGGYSASVPELPGCYTCGDTLDELRSNLKEAIALYLKDEDIKREPTFVMPVSID